MNMQGVKGILTSWIESKKTPLHKNFQLPKLTLNKNFKSLIKLSTSALLTSIFPDSMIDLAKLITKIHSSLLYFFTGSTVTVASSSLAKVLTAQLNSASNSSGLKLVSGLGGAETKACINGFLVTKSVTT